MPNVFVSKKFKIKINCQHSIKKTAPLLRESLYKRRLSRLRPNNFKKRRKNLKTDAHD